MKVLIYKSLILLKMTVVTTKKVQMLHCFPSLSALHAMHLVKDCCKLYMIL